MVLFTCPATGTVLVDEMFGIGREREKEWMAFEAEALPLMPDVYRVAQWLVRDSVEAEDLTQETFTQALKAFHRYTPDTNCRAWLMTILYRINGKRRMKLGRLKLVEDADDLIEQTVVFEPPIPTAVTDDEILEALKRIPGNFCEVVILADVEEFSYREIAQMLQLPIGTVMSRLHRGRRLLRQELTGYARKAGLVA